jgi:adenine-specific DNA methylase
LQPTEQTPNTSSGPVAAIEKDASAASPELLFSAVLQFQTSQPIAANDFIEKKIHTLGLMNFTTSQRQSDRTSYKIVCSRKYVEGLVGELADLWSHSEKTAYALLDTSTKQPVRVEGIDAQQTLAMIRLADTSAAAKLARNISEQNTQKVLAKVNPADAASGQLPEKPSKPILAWDKDAQQVPADGQDTICLVIEVLGQ